MPHGLNIVLIEPEIPQNTGSIGRLCLAVQAKLHLVHPLAFEITDAKLRRAGLDYWEHLQVVEHASIEKFVESLPVDAPLALFTKKAGKTLYQHRFQPGTYLIFGKETMGLPEWFINKYPADSVRIPLYDARVRSLNLATAAGIGVYEAIRQLGF